MAPGGCNSAPAAEPVAAGAPSFADMFNPTYLKELSVKLATDLAREMDAWIKINKGTDKMKTGSNRAKRYLAFAAAANLVVTMNKKDPNDIAAIMAAAGCMQQYGEPPDEVIKALQKNLGKGESLSFTHVDDSDEEEEEEQEEVAGPPTVQEASAAATKIVTEAFDKQNWNRHKKPIEDYMAAEKHNPPTLSDAARAKFIRLVSQEICIPRQGDPDVQWRVFPEWEKKIKDWSTSQKTLMKQLVELLNAPDADTDLDTLRNIGVFAKKVCVENTLAKFKTVFDSLIAGDKEAIYAAFTKKINKAWKKMDKEAANKAATELCNVMVNDQLSETLKKGALVFLSTPAGELPIDLRAQDGFDGGKTALCKAIEKCDVDTVTKILAKDGTKEQLELGGFSTNVTQAWESGSTAMNQMLKPVIPLIMCAFSSDRKKGDEMAEKLMQIHCPAPTEIMDGTGTTFLMLSLNNTALALKLIAMDSSNECIAAMDQTKATVLHKLAFVQGNTVANALIKANKEGVLAVLKNPDIGSTTALMMAAYYGNEDLCKLWVGLDGSKEHLEMGAFGATPLSCSKGTLQVFMQAAWDKVKEN